MIKRIFSLILALSLLVSAFILPSSADGIIPSVSAKGAVLLDASDSRILYEKNAALRLPMASTTKIMTALVALESRPPDETVIIPTQATGIEGSSVYLTAGERLTLLELLYAVLLASANDAATAVAIHIGGSVDNFAVLMNQKAEQLGLNDTQFRNPHGLDADGHYTTALDLARLTAYALKNPDFKKIVSTYKYNITGPDGNRRYLVNHNRLLRSYDGAIGVKTGFTKSSGRCLVSAAERDGLILVAVTLSDPNDWHDHTAMLDYGFLYYKSVTLAENGQLFYTLPVVGGNLVPCTSDNTVIQTVLRYGGEITSVIECERFLWDMPDNGEIMGRVLFYRDDNLLTEVNLIATVAAEPAPEKFNLWEWFRNLFNNQ